MQGRTGALSCVAKGGGPVGVGAGSGVWVWPESPAWSGAGGHWRSPVSGTGGLSPALPDARLPLYPRSIPLHPPRGPGPHAECPTRKPLGPASTPSARRVQPGGARGVTLESQLSPRAQRERWAPIHHTFPRCSAEIRLYDQLFILRADPSEIPRKSGKRPAGAEPPRPHCQPQGPGLSPAGLPFPSPEAPRSWWACGHAQHCLKEAPLTREGAPQGGTARASPGLLPSPRACPADERQARGPQPVL